MPALQVIDENKQFSHDVNAYFEKNNIAHSGLDYNIIAVFGSQSTGKSTLLNALFGTKFGVMDASVTREQTTKGIWLGIENKKGSTATVVLDVEGTDGRERGEDQDFERKAALFALASSEILIINMWEQQVGLYVGANMALLRTVFEVNLSLFQTGHGKQQRSRILFVIRDHIGVTPLANLAKTLREDLELQWQSLSKPEGLENTCIDDFFDLDFAALPHKVLQEEKFNQAVADLRVQLTKSIKPEYHRNVPIDGWSVYAEKVWEQIEMNKDLDLPTHQILVSRFRCEEIADQAFHSFEASVADFKLPFGDSVVIPDFGETLRKARAAVLAVYDETAGRYHKAVYNEKRLELLGKVDGTLTTYFASQLAALKTEAVALFWSQLEKPTTSNTTNINGGETYGQRIANAASIARAKFIEGATEAIIDPSFFSYHAQEEELDAELKRESAQARQAELRKMLKRISRTISSRLDHVSMHFEQYPEKLEYPWDAVLETLKLALNSVIEEAPEDLGLGGSVEEITGARLSVETEAWKALANKIASLTTQDAVLQRMRDKFENTFRYTAEGLPIVWSPGDDIDAAGVKARQSAQSILPMFSSAKLSDGSVLCTPAEVAALLRSEDEEVPDFMVLLTSEQQREIERRFQRVADAAFIDAKRSVMQQSTHIPAYIFVIIAILGWNEFTAVLRNPFLLVLVLMICGGGYVIWSLGMANAALNVADSTFQKILAESKHYLRELVLSDHEKNTRAPHAVSNSNSPLAAPGSPRPVGSKAFPQPLHPVSSTAENIKETKDSGTASE